MKKYNREIKITVFLVSISVLVLVILGGFFLYQHIQEENKAYLLLYDNNIWEIDNGNITDVIDQNKINNLLRTKEFEIYSQNQFVTKSKIQFINSTWKYPSNTGATFIKYPMVAYTGPGSIEVINTKIETLEEKDYKILNQFTKEKGYTLDSNTNFTYVEKTSFDFDLDGKEETFYAVTNLYDSYDEITEETKSFQIVLYYDEENSQVLNNDYVPKDEERKNNITAHQIISIIKLPNEEKYGIVLNKYKSMGELNICPTLYLYQNDHYEQVKTCKEMES